MSEQRDVEAWIEQSEENIMPIMINRGKEMLRISPKDNTTDAIKVDTSVIEYGLLQVTFILATVRYDMMAAQRWILTAFSEYPHRVFTVMFCLIHLKNTSIPIDGGKMDEREFKA